MLPHHLAWLSVHPERSQEWLSERLRDGFDVHHLDGDHSNNDPSNLVLIDAGDHLMLHNGKTRVPRLSDIRRGGGRPRKTVAAEKPSRHVLDMRKAIEKIDAEVFKCEA